MTARETAVAASLVALAIVMAMVAPAYFAPGNLRDLLLSNLPVLIVAIGSMLVILTGEIDISCGSMFAICSVVAGMVAKETGSVALAFLAAVSAGITLGSLAGLAVAYGRIPSIVVTLAMLVALRDGLRWATGGAWVTDLPRAFQWFGLNQESYPLVAGALALGLCAVMAWILRGTAGGRWLYAVGSNAAAARLAGIRVERVKVATFALAGALTAIAAVVNAARFSQVPSNTGLGLEMKVVAAVVVGGAAVTGGVGTIRGTVLGVLLLGAIGPALTFMGVTAYWERALQGAIILAAVGLDAWRTHRASQASGRRCGRGGAHQMSGRVRRWFPNGEWAPLAALAVAILVFAVIAPRFLTVANFFEVTRFSVEIGLIAIGITPVLITGGIDLSVGSILGLTAVIFGIAHVDWHLSTLSAAGLALLVGVAGGSLNAVLIARLSIPPLIVTLGTLSLFRGIAEGLTQAAVNYSGFPPGFLALGQGYLAGGIPTQLPILVAVVAGYAVLVHRSGDRPHVVRDWIQRRRRALCRRTGGATDRARLRALGRDGKPRRDHLRGACRAGARRRGHRLRARRRDRGGPGRDLGVRRTGDDRRYSNRALRAGSAEERPRAGGTSSGAHGGADRCAARRHHCARSDAPRRTGRFHVGRRRD